MLPGCSWFQLVQRGGFNTLFIIRPFAIARVFVRRGERTKTLADILAVNSSCYFFSAKYKFAISSIKFSGREPTKFVKMTTEILSSR